METVKASVVEEGNKYFIEIATDEKHIRIPLSEDKPNMVKRAFNRLIERIKEGEFNIALENGSDDLFSQVAKEYITQLNRDIAEVRDEMIQYGLIDDEGGVETEDGDDRL